MIDKKMAGSHSKRPFWMLTNDQLLRSSSWLTLQLISTTTLGYIFWLICARSFAPEIVGQVAATLSTITTLSLFANVGAGHTLIERLPQIRRPDTWTRTVVRILAIACLASLALSVSVALALMIFQPASLPLTDIGTAWLLVAGTVGWTLLNTLNFFFIALRSSGWTVLAGVVLQALRLSVLVLIVTMGVSNSDSILVSWIATVFLVVALMLVWPFRRVRASTLRYSVAPTEAGDTSAKALANLASSLAAHHTINIAGALPGLLFPTLVTLRVGAENTAYFYVTWSMSATMGIMSGIMATALFTEGVHQPEKLRTFVGRAAMVTTVILAILAAGLTIFGNMILTGFGQNYRRQGLMLLLILIPAGLLDGMNNIATGAWRAQGRLRLAVLVSVTTTVTGLASAWVLLAPLGITGVGVAWLAANGVGAIWVVLSKPLIP